MALEGWPSGQGLQSLLERARRIFQEVRRDNFEHDFCPLVLTDGGGNRLEVLVSCDALKIDGVRVNVDAFTQQEIADELGAVLLTPKLYDEIWRAAPGRNRMTPHPRVISTTTDAMIAHSADVDREAQAKGASAPPPIANVGKTWVLSSRLFTPGALDKNRAANYGWIGGPLASDTSVTGLPIIQSVGTHHTAGAPGTAGHTDYSQLALFAHRSATYNEAPVDLADVITGDAPGTALVSHEGPLPSARQPFPGSGPQPPPGPPPAPPGPQTPPTPTGGGGGAPSTGAAIVGGIAGAAAGAATGAPLGAGLGAAVGAILGLVLGRKKKRAA